MSSYSEILYKELQEIKQSRLRRRNRGADLLATVLRAKGVQQITALTGGAIMEGIDALHSDEELRVLFSQTEQGAAWSAMGYARATGRIGVCVVTSGPAATNTLTPLADAHRDNVPLVVITGQVPTTARNTDAFQEINITEIAAPLTKKVFYLSQAEDIPSTISEAFRIAKEGRPGPVLVDFTKDAQQAVLDPGRLKKEALEEFWEQSLEPSLPEKGLDEVIRHLRQAKRPVVIAGYGVVLAGAQEPLREFLQVAPCPVVHTLPGKAALPSNHPLNFGMLGMHGFYIANWMVHYSDLIISFGSRYDDRITGDTEKFGPTAQRLIHFDIEAEQIAKVLPERKLGVVGDLKYTLPALNHRLKDSGLDFRTWYEEISKVASEYPSDYKRKPDTLQTQYALQMLNRIIGDRVASTGQRVIFATEVGDHQMWAGQFLKIQQGWRFMTSSGQGAMGSGLPMAIGAQWGDPEALVICLAGDGSLRMSEAELETIIEYNLPVKVIVLNNHGYGIVRMWNHLFYEGREAGVVKTRKNWALVARGNGFSKENSSRVSDVNELEEALRTAIQAESPYLLEMITPYEECLPLLPPGKSFADIIL